MTAQELLMALWAEFPSPSTLLAVLILIGGIMMLLVGRQLLTVLLLALGAALGYALGSWLAGHLDSTLPIWAPGLVGAIVLGGILVMAQRAIVPACLAITLALVGPVAFSISNASIDPLGMQSEVTSSIVAPTEVQTINAPPSASLDWQLDGSPDLRSHASPLTKILDSVTAWWPTLTPGNRGGIMLTVLIGLVVGLLVGIALPKITATFITAAFGAAITLASISWLIMIYRELANAPTPKDWLETVGLWLILTTAGCLLQWALAPSSKATHGKKVTIGAAHKRSRKHLSSGDSPSAA
jgi:hypothetical protein